MDKDLLSLVQREVHGIITELAGHDAQLDALKTKLEKDEVARREETDEILMRLVSMEKILSEELLRRVEGVEHRVEGVEQRVEEVEHRVQGVEQSLAETNIKVEVQGKRVQEGMTQLQDSLAKTDGKVEQLAHKFKNQRMEDVKPG